MLSTQAKEALGPLFPILNKVRLQFLRLKLAGNKVLCPCCGSKYSEFAPFGDSRRKNAWCPKCESLERHRLLWMYFENKTDLYTKPHKMLHVAPETIFMSHFKKQKNIDYHPVDIFPHLYPAGTQYFDVLNHNEPDNSYDVIICNHVFQYIEDDKTAINNLYKLMTPGGWGIMQVPINGKTVKTYEDSSITDPQERLKAFGLKEHVRYYGLDYADRLRAAGFNVRVDDYTAEFSEADNYKYGFWKGDAIYYVSK
ncbi:MAG: SAM-dependent methyltransferase [Ferruginibacter sp.]|nr:SAM-dependent methyltransferase [Ferruginibacter sp.]